MKLSWLLVVTAIINGEPVVQRHATGQETFATQRQCEDRINHPVVKRSYEQDYWPGKEIILYCKKEQLKPTRGTSNVVR